MVRTTKIDNGIVSEIIVNLLLHVFQLLPKQIHKTIITELLHGFQ